MEESNVQFVRSPVTVIEFQLNISNYPHMHVLDMR